MPFRDKSKRLFSSVYGGCFLESRLERNSNGDFEFIDTDIRDPLPDLGVTDLGVLLESGAMLKDVRSTVRNGSISPEAVLKALYPETKKPEQAENNEVK